ncbi:hypothetical protein D5039_04955 [Verminephrobacter aporrectodeae subsp. tuberculatae]|uniref:Uncharacterized protein n=1 Tax=Verminephrobacter aporrectodeae subsp. tuberculatae TaxID=1110392 RepID=A0ABT3KQG3_9BURK|nr:hypothetical protein [Verminephrobacter aporrectodeae]MCW5320553.1 hypothetical protein [Verminephrobacter aporrectodeae subsp. tuberculatae]
MNYALIKKESQTLGRVLNIIVADPEFIESIAPDWDHIEAIDIQHELGLGVGIDWGYDLVNGGFIDPTPATDTATQRPRIVVATITADAAHAGQLVLEGLHDATCPAGTTLRVVAKLQLDDQVLPMDGVFRVPFRARDGRERVLLGSMVQGVINFNVLLPDSGVWMVTEAAINEALPPEQQMQFAGLTIYTVDT